MPAQISTTIGAVQLMVFSFRCVSDPGGSPPVGSNVGPRPSNARPWNSATRAVRAHWLLVIEERRKKPFVRPFNQAPAAALAGKVPTKLSNVNIFIIEKKEAARKRSPPPRWEQSRARYVRLFGASIPLPRPSRQSAPRSYPHERGAFLGRCAAGLFQSRE